MMRANPCRCPGKHPRQAKFSPSYKAIHLTATAGVVAYWANGLLSALAAAQDACAAFLSDQLRARDAAGWAATQVPRIWAWADFTARDALAHDCREFACRQFPEVARSPGVQSSLLSIWSLSMCQTHGLTSSTS